MLMDTIKLCETMAKEDGNATRRNNPKINHNYTFCIENLKSHLAFAGLVISLDSQVLPAFTSIPHPFQPRG